ncbi:hypothetical protein ASF55_20605 [Methylobacterium sp. Leaf119]|nr:hypothetical protein ASF55_20605 [Methylobacterium sp. Leaf119]
MWCGWSTRALTLNAEVEVMTLAALLLLMPIVMTAITLAAGERLEAFPNKDDLWQLPRRSSVL